MNSTVRETALELFNVIEFLRFQCIIRIIQIENATEEKEEEEEDGKHSIVKNG